jgi:protein-L-isoaspartate O-methyltransferase
MKPIILFMLPLAVMAQSQKAPVNRLAPFVSTPQNVVEKMLELAQVKPHETVYDLGSGDGRVLIAAAQMFAAKAVGIEISPKEVVASRERIAKLHLDDRVKVVEGDLLKQDLSGADVVTIYLLTATNDLIKPNLEKYLKPGARVVSHDYPIRGWTPSKVEKIEAYKREHTLYVYVMPPVKQP